MVIGEGGADDQLDDVVEANIVVKERVTILQLGREGGSGRVNWNLSITHMYQ